MASRKKSWIVWAGICLFPLALDAQAAVIQYDTVDLSNSAPGLWQNRFTVSGFSFPKNYGFTIYFGPASGFQPKDI